MNIIAKNTVSCVVAAVITFFITIIMTIQLNAEEKKIDPDALFPSGKNTLITKAVPDQKYYQVFDGKEHIGFVFSTREITASVGYSGKPLDIYVGLGIDGKISGAKLISHQEPILVIGVSDQDLQNLVQNLIGLDIKTGTKLKSISKQSGPDHISGATISSLVIKDSILRSARVVARKTGILGSSKGSYGSLDRVSFKSRTWDELVKGGYIKSRRITLYDVAKKADDKPNEPDRLINDLHISLLTPPAIGQNLIGKQRYERLMAATPLNDNLLLLAGNGSYSLKGTAYRRSGTFDRIEIIQGKKTIQIRKDGYQNLLKLAVKDAPEFRETGIFRIPEKTGFNPVLPFRLELLVSYDTSQGLTKLVSMEVKYKIPNDLVIAPKANIKPKKERELWEQIWSERKQESAILVTMFLVLAMILLFQDELAKRVKLYRITRVSFLVFTFVFLGLYSGAQLSVVNLIAFSQSLLGQFKWENFLLDPLIFMLWSFVALALLFWGRGVFCGWLCPFGALQELLNAGARRIGIKQIKVPWPLHERLWPIKYIAFLLILGVSLKSVSDAYWFAEIEPFKTVIILKFFRDWQFVVYALILLGMGLFIERFYCRYLCPMGAALAIPAKLRLFEWLKRRPQCGRECRICEDKCTVQAINPIGQINPNECIYCLKCQANYYDTNTCVVLKRRAARRRQPEQA